MFSKVALFYAWLYNRWSPRCTPTGRQSGADAALVQLLPCIVAALVRSPCHVAVAGPLARNFSTLLFPRWTPNCTLRFSCCRWTMPLYSRVLLHCCVVDQEVTTALLVLLYCSGANGVVHTTVVVLVDCREKVHSLSLHAGRRRVSRL